MVSTFGAPAFARSTCGHAGVDSSVVRATTPGNSVPGPYSVGGLCPFVSMSQLLVAVVAPPARRSEDPSPPWGVAHHPKRMKHCAPRRLTDGWTRRCGAWRRTGSVSGRQRVDGDRDREDQRRVLACRDVDAVGVAHAEPLLGNRCDRVAVALDLILVVDDVAVGLHVVAVLDVDGEAVADPDQRLVHGGGGLAVALDGDLVADAQLALLDPRGLLARAVFEHEGLPGAKRLAVDLVGALSLAILDPEVVADRQQPFAHHEALAVRPVVPPQKTHVPTLMRAASHRIPRIG